MKWKITLYPYLWTVSLYHDCCEHNMRISLGDLNPILTDIFKFFSWFCIISIILSCIRYTLKIWPRKKFALRIFQLTVINKVQDTHHGTHTDQTHIQTYVLICEYPLSFNFLPKKKYHCLTDLCSEELSRIHGPVKNVPRNFLWYFPTFRSSRFYLDFSHIYFIFLL